MFNFVIVTGWVGRPAEFEESAGESAKRFAKISLATKRKWTDLDGVRHEITTWHTIEAWEDKALILRNVAKGDLLQVTGYIKNEVHDGKFHSTIVAQTILRLKTKEAGRLQYRDNLHALVNALDDHDRAVLHKLLQQAG